MKFSLKQFAAYRADFIFRLFSMILMMIIMYFVLSLPFTFTDSIAGWGHFDVLVLISIYYISNGLMWFFFRNGIGELESLVKNGNFDGKLMKPVKTSFLISFFKVDVARLGDILVAAGFLAVLLINNSLTISLVGLLGALLACLSGVWIASRLFLIINSLSFWVTETYLDHVANPLFVVAKYPVDIWPRNFQQLLYWVLPVAFLSTVPAAILVGRLGLVWSVAAFGLAIIWTILANLFWNFALKHYSSTGS